MSSLPKDAITGVFADSLLTFSGDDRRWHAALPCFNHLPEIINSLEQHPLGILVASQKLINVCSRAGQGFPQSLILCLQHLFPSQACVKGVFKGGNPLRERFCAAADQCGRRAALCLGKLLYDSTGRSSTSLLENVAVGQWLSKRNTLLDYLLNSLPIGMPRTPGCSRFAHSSNMVANATALCRKTSNRPWNRQFPWNKRGAETRETLVITGIQGTSKASS